MTKIVNLKISNFRGISHFEENFNSNFICLIGRGDSSKTTILEAIASVLSPSWNLSFYDTDFYNCDTDKNIEIEATVVDFPNILLDENNKFGTYIRGYDGDNVSDEIKDNHQKALTIKLEVDKNLEPKWSVKNGRQEEKPISANDRARLNCFFISDYVDRHFSWNKGNPLYSLLDSDKKNDEIEENIIINSLREAKNKIDCDDFEKLKEVTEKIKYEVKKFGLNVEKIKTTIDFKDIIIKDGKICLHDDNIPFRLKGKGSKRLISMAIQLAIEDDKGIVLIDEVEQGLEYDRTIHIIQILKHNEGKQIFTTTHSNVVIVELGVENLYLTQKTNEGKVSLERLSMDNNKLQGTVRACPEAFLAKKIIACEGSTEVGICRAINEYLIKNKKTSLSLNDCFYVNAQGSNFNDRVKEIRKYFTTCIFMDSDKESEDKKKKEELTELGVKIFDHEKGNDIEKQAFKDLPEEGLDELILYVKKVNNKIKTDLTNRDDKEKELTDNYKNNSKNNHKSSFKHVYGGESLGNVIIKYLDKMEGKHLKETVEGLIEWITKE
jgi:predicted ATP-dependent endonuclease of OLD family